MTRIQLKTERYTYVEYLREHFPHMVNHAITPKTETEAWCVEHFGAPLTTYDQWDGGPDNLTLNPEAQWDYFGSEVYFKNDKHAVHFKLRWYGEKDA